MKDHGNTCGAAGTTSQAAVQSDFCKTAADTSRHCLEQGGIFSIVAGKLYRSVNPRNSVSERIMSHHGFNEL